MIEFDWDAERERRYHERIEQIHRYETYRLRQYLKSKVASEGMINQIIRKHHG